MFATLLATPCSAPFLGTAVAFALGAPLHALWLIFLMLGVGMSLPWLFVALVPKTAMLLPKPGRWMNTLKVVLGLMMLASSLWLATLLSVHLGEAVSQIVMLVLIAVALVLFALKGQNPRRCSGSWSSRCRRSAGIRRAGCLTRRLTLRHKTLRRPSRGSRSAKRLSSRRWRRGNGCLWISRRTGA
jgi:thiol:disulfide interchange protein